MFEVLNKNFPNGLEFDSLPYVERLVYHEDVDIPYYTGLENELIKAIERYDAFRKMADELIDNGYEYKFSSLVTFPHSKAEWVIKLIVT